MNKNLGYFETLLRTLIGFLLMCYLFLGGPWISIIGLYLLFSGCLRFCFIKKLVTG